MGCSKHIAKREPNSGAQQAWADATHGAGHDSASQPAAVASRQTAWQVSSTLSIRRALGTNTPYCIQGRIRGTA
jgi:hypothetical protein